MLLSKMSNRKGQQHESTIIVNKLHCCKDHKEGFDTKVIMCSIVSHTKGIYT